MATETTTDWIIPGQYADRGRMWRRRFTPSDIRALIEEARLQSEIDAETYNIDPRQLEAYEEARTFKRAKLQPIPHIDIPDFSIPGLMAPNKWVADASRKPWVEKGYPNTKKGYSQYLDELEGPTTVEPVVPSDLLPRTDPRRLDQLRELDRGRDKPLLGPLPKPKRKSLLEGLSPYAETGNMILGKGKEALAMVDQYLKENPETISGLVGPGSAGPVGMVFKRGVPIATQLVNRPSDMPGGRPVGLTENPTTWWVKGAAEIDPKYKALQEAGRAGSGEEAYHLHPELVKRTGGPAEGRMSMTLNHDTGVAKLEFVGVSPEWRGSGFGAELLDSAAKMAKIKGMTSIELNALPGSVMSAQSKPVKSPRTGQDMPLSEWYEQHGYVVEPDQPQVGGMVPMRLDLTKWPAQGKGNIEYEMRNRTSRRLIEGMDPKARPPDVPPTKAKYFVPEEVDRDFVHSGPMARQRARRMERDEANPLRRRELAEEANLGILERMDAPDDIAAQYRERGRLPEAWSELPYADTPTMDPPWFYSSRDVGSSERYAPEMGNYTHDDLVNMHQAYQTRRPLGYRPGEAMVPEAIPVRPDRGRPDPGESWSDYLARIRGLQR